MRILLSPGQVLNLFGLLQRQSREAPSTSVRRVIEDFLSNEWRNGALLGDKPEKAFFLE